MIALIVSVIAALVLAILLFPVNIYLNSVRSGGNRDGGLSVSWIIFLFRYALKEKRLEFLVLGRRIFSGKSPEKKPLVPAKEKKFMKPRKIPPLGDYLNITGPMIKLLKDLVNAFRVRYFDIDINFGLEDPGFTGILTGLIHTVRGSFGIGQNFRFTPDFTGTVLDWNLKINASITPIKIIIIFIMFATNRKVLRLALQNLTLSNK